MTYLLLQMLLALSLAALMGGAIGWLIHRSAHTARIHELRQGLMRQQGQLNQAQSEVAMLSDDYDEMHRRTQEEIEALRQENQQIPFLNTNLEKSQLLVRQMMQRHEAKVRDLSSENQTLTSRLKSIEDREQAYNQVQAELDSRRREKNRLADLQTDEDGHTSAGNDSAGQKATTNKSSNPQDQNSFSQDLPLSDDLALASAALISNAKPSGSWASAPVDIDSPDQVDSGRTIDIDADVDPFDNVIEVGDELQRELDNSAPDDATLDNEPDANSLSSAAANRLPSGEQSISTDDNSSSSVSSVTVDTVSSATEQLDFELSDTDDAPDDDDPSLDGSSDASGLFDPVEQRDDLQQIFGIGPVTEKALNDMGITSYSQLADLKHHEIQTIADALQIVPGRIERDDWMGNARRQLEEVLEQL